MLHIKHKGGKMENDIILETLISLRGIERRLYSLSMGDEHLDYVDIQAELGSMSQHIKFLLEKLEELEEKTDKD